MLDSGHANVCKKTFQNHIEQQTQNPCSAWSQECQCDVFLTICSSSDVFTLSCVYQQLILECAEQLPHKIPLYGRVIGLLNLENEEFVVKLVENTQTNLQQRL